MKTHLGVLFCLLVAGASSASAEDKVSVVWEKQANKEKQRWSIADWLDTRDRMRVQDLWLSLHSPSPYEFYFDAAYKTATIQSGGKYQGWDFTAAAYATIFGIELQYQTSNLDTRWLVMGNFRFFGAYNQATNLTLQGGAKEETRAGTSAQLWNPLAGAHLTVYIAKPAGFTALYRHYFSYGQGLAQPVDRYEAGLFIDFKFVRLHADVIVESATLDTSRSYAGFQAGTRLYF